MSDQVAIEKKEPVIETPVQQPAAEPKNTDTAEHMIPKSRFDEVNTVKANLEKELQKFKDAEQKRKETEMSETEKLQNRAKELEAENKRLKTESLKQSIATKLGLPESLALRLQGETPEEIEKDAKEILETLPKKTAVNINATNPGAGAVVGETDDERGRRLGTRR
jgi:vacuolar-type H+-ATPase subunit I/STV1